MKNGLYSMKETCLKVGMNYEALKFYCKEGLVPNVKRDSGNRRVFDERDIAWLNSLQCLRRCGMGIKEMHRYMELCLEGVSSIPERKVLLEEKRKILCAHLTEIEDSLAYIEKKQRFFDEILEGKREYTSNILPEDSPLKKSGLVSDAG